MDKLNALPKGSLILVTGANGFIGSSVVDCILQLGFRVRGTVRTQKPWLDSLFQTKYGSESFESIIVPSLEDESDVCRAMDGVSGVVHVASDVSFNPDPNVVIGKVVNMTKCLIAAAAKQGSVKRFVMTSASAAALVVKPDETGRVVDQNTWNDAYVKAAWDPNTPDRQRSSAVYAASKTEAERYAWAWVREHKPAFVLNTVLPNWTIGKTLSPEISGLSSGLIRNLVHGDETILNVLKPQHYVYIQDIARLHAIALLAPDVHDQRIYGFAGPFGLTDIISILRRLQPDNSKIPEAPRDEGHDLTTVVDAPKAEAWLKEYFGCSGWTSLEDAVREAVAGA